MFFKGLMALVAVTCVVGCGSDNTSSSSSSSGQVNASSSSSSGANVSEELSYDVSEMDTETWYTIHNSQSGLLFDIEGISLEAGAALIQWSESGGDNQIFRFEKQDDDLYRIISRNSGMALDLLEFNTNDGADIVQWAERDGGSQAFEFQKLENGHYRIVNELSGKALVPEANSVETLARITQEEPGDNPYQQWQLESQGSYSEPVIPEPGEAAECGTIAADVVVTGGPGGYQIDGGSAGSNFYSVINTALGRLPANRNQQATLSVRASGNIGTSSIDIPSNTIFEVCGTINVGNSPGRGSIRVTNASNVSIPHLKMTGSPYFGLEFWGVNNLHLGQLDLRFDGGLGIRFQRDRPGSRNVAMDYVYVSGTGNHGVETWNVDGLEIGTVVARDVGYAGLLLNNTRNANIGLVDGDNVASGTGYATMRFANTNGRVGNAYPSNIYVDKVVSRGGGRGIFCVSQSGGVEINSIDLAGNGNNSILIENCYNVKINGGTINGGGELRLAARSEFSNNRDITISNVSVNNTSVRESPCGENVTWENLNVQGGSRNICN